MPALLSEKLGSHFQLVNLPFLLVLLVFMSSSLSYPYGNPDDCDNNTQYYDHGTGYCEECSEICLLAEMQDTKEQCQNNCPRYLKRRQCEKKGHRYFDQSRDTCESCCLLCHSLQLIARFPHCTSTCTDSLNKKTDEHWVKGARYEQRTAPSPTSLCAHQGKEPDSAGQGLLHVDRTDDDSNTTWSWVIIVIVTCCVTILLVFVVVLLGVVHPLSATKVHTVAIGVESAGQARRGSGCRYWRVASREPVEETLRCPRSGQQNLAVVANGSSGQPSTTLKMVFSDLRVDGCRGDSV